MQATKWKRGEVTGTYRAIVAGHSLRVVKAGRAFDGWVGSSCMISGYSLRECKQNLAAHARDARSEFSEYKFAEAS